MFIYNTVENISIEELHDTFLDAFSDYQVKMDLPLLNAVRQWNGKLSAYDTGTAVIPNYRNHGITSNMFINAKGLLKKMKVEQYLLEVIQSNTSAVNLYKKQGFEILREFKCFNLDKNKCTSETIYNVKHIKIITESLWQELTKFWDFKPSWQNSIDSINAVPDNFIYSIVNMDEIIVGYGIIDKNTGDIPQIAVDKNCRGKGIGKSIFTDLLNNTESDTIKVLNVDSQSASMKSFLLNLGFNQNVKQYEMVLKL